MFQDALRKPAALHKGDHIRLIAPASPYRKRDLRRGWRIIEQLGYQPVISNRSIRKTGFLAGDDAERADELQQAFLERETSAVWCIRGGYGSARLLGRLDMEAIRKRPKMIIGFSDITAVLVALSSPGGFVTFHGPVVTQLPVLNKKHLDWMGTLFSGQSIYLEAPLGRVKTLVPGTAEGRLVGGNLSMLTSLIGTPYLPCLDGSIVFIEDTGEQAYRLDRLFWQLREAGVLDSVAGLVLGSLNACKPVGRTRFSAEAVMERAISELGVPCVSGANFGHITRNVALPVGVLARLEATRGKLTLLESCVQ